MHAKENDLPHDVFWRRYRRLANREKKARRMIAQAQLHSFRTSIKCKFGVKIPKNHEQAVLFDKENGNDCWAQAERLEVWELQSLNSFKSIGRNKPPRGCKVIPIFFAHDRKEDFRLKARLVAGGHVLPPPLESVCAGVVSLRSVRLVCFIAELNALDLCQGDISNACLESCCTELLAFIAGPEFGELWEQTTRLFALAACAVQVTKLCD